MKNNSAECEGTCEVCECLFLTKKYKNERNGFVKKNNASIIEKS